MLNYPIYYDPNELSPREEEIKGLICKGKEVPEIAEELCIQPCTVRTHLNNIYEKTNLHGQKALMAARIKELEEKLNGFTTATN